MEKTLGSLITVNTDFIIKWNENRQAIRTIQTIFKDQGNVFNFVRPNNLTKSMHIYFATNARGLLNFYFISAENDAAKRFNWIYSTEIRQDKETLPEQTTPNGYEEGNLNWAIANSWVNNWINPIIRSIWINNKFNTDVSKNYIVLAFDINVDDFVVNDMHNCFFGLKKDQNGKYQIDLIVYNTATKRIVNKYDSVRDLARPVPPFGGDGLTYENFGVLDSLGIK